MKAAIFRFIRSLFLILTLVSFLPGQVTHPALVLTSNPALAWETDNSVIQLSGTASIGNDISNIFWVNQMGQRGSGTWASSGGTRAIWTVASLPLRPGINLIAVTVVDVKNNSRSLHLAINRKPPAGTQPPQPLEVRTGTWKNRPIVYQLMNGMAVVEGDIILGPAASLGGQGLTSNGLSISYLSQLWPAVSGVSQVPYIISGSNANLSTAISNFNSQFSGLIQFVARTSQSNYVDITVLGGASGEGFSNVGMVGGEQTLECGDGCTVATWLHEMGHTVGLLHEHQRPDRQNHITLNLSNADLPNVPGNFTLFSFDYQTTGLYDYASVMHYASFDFSKAGLPVIESIPAGIPLSNNSGYSAGDVDQIERLYDATPSAVTVTTNPSGLGIVVDGASYTAPHAFSWSLNSSHTLTVAPDPQYTSPTDGSTYQFGNWNDLGAKSHTITVSPGSGTLTSPTRDPAVTIYEANFIRLQPFAYDSPAVYPTGAGTVSQSPAPISEYGGSFYTDRTLVQLTLTPTPGSGYNFYDWFNLPFPPSDNPHSFYIQSPLTEAQAVFVSTPVTIIGESITGPNTWNPGLAGSVDGSFTYLPTAFSSYYNGAAWNAGTSHAITVDQTQSPVTTNVFYNWDSWSDGGALSHNITQPASGSQTISAAFTPFYATYTVPPPLGGQNSACYGGVTTSPAGVPYSENTVFSFYEDGTSVTSTATANAIYPAMSFTGWSGSLGGTINPDTTTIHDQFVPTALFNVAPTSLTISSLSPASAAASSGAINITVNGTGFTSTDTYAYWNGSYRSVSYVSATQLTVHLNANDIAAAGAQDLFIGNYTTSGSNPTCGVGAETSFTVTGLPAGPPVVISLSPNSGTGSTQTFAATYSDPRGSSALSNVRILLNSSINADNACYVLYYPSTNLMYLETNTGGTPSGGSAPGSSGQQSNSQCTLNGAGSSVTTSGNKLTFNLALSFTATFSGQTNVYLEANDSNTTTSGWVQEGTWTPGSAGPPTIVSLSPNSGTGLTQTFTGVYSDPRGEAFLNNVKILFNTSINAANACYVLYYPGTNEMYLETNTGGTPASGIAPGSSGQQSNSQCTLTGSGSSVSISGANLTFKVALTFTSAFSGSKNVFMEANDSNSSSSGWVQEGSWTPGSAGPPGIVSLSPNSGTGLIQTFGGVYSDPRGEAFLGNVKILFNTSITASSACYVIYYPATNLMYLETNGGGLPSSGIAPGSSGSQSNGQCTLTGSSSSVSVSGTNLTFQAALTFATAFSGQKNAYMEGNDSNGATSGWVQEGTWNP